MVIDTDCSRLLIGLVAGKGGRCGGEGHVVYTNLYHLGGFGLTECKCLDLHRTISRTVDEYGSLKIALFIYLGVCIAILSRTIIVGSRELDAHGLSIQLTLHLTRHQHIFARQIVCLVGRDRSDRERCSHEHGFKDTNRIVGCRELVDGTVGVDHGIEPAVAHQLGYIGSKAESFFTTYYYIFIQGSTQQRCAGHIIAHTATCSEIEVDGHALGQDGSTRIAHNGREDSRQTRIEVTLVADTCHHGIRQRAVGNQQCVLSLSHV